MLELIAGGIVGLLVAVTSQWVATGGRLRRLRSTIKDELELSQLLGTDVATDPVHAKLRAQARMHIVEYLDDPGVDGTADLVRRRIFMPTWAALAAIASLTAFVLAWTETGPQFGGLVGVVTGFTVTVGLGAVARLATHFASKYIARRHLSKGLRVALARREWERIAAQEPETPSTGQ